ncbi:MAG: DUF547 domain-containing protein [Rhizobiales bacterium]|nr:DUF547 domain-containing protein [Hyphomicrobiales bacterium]
MEDRTVNRRTVLKSGLASLALTGAGAPPLLAAPKAVLWERWTAHDPASQAAIDHGLWQALLQRCLVTGSDGINRFAYAKAAAAAPELDGYLEQMAALPISTYSRPEQMAYWINLYNALTVSVVRDHYPVDGIRDIDISPGLFSDGPWGRKLLTIEQERVALDDMEHQILRPIWQDPRVHYAVNCASLGCPNLQPVPFTAARLDRQLDAAAIEFVNHRRALELRGDRLRASSIYDWFQEDFGGSEQGVIAHLRAYLLPDLAMKLEGVHAIDDYGYDWRLNDASKPTGS